MHADLCVENVCVTRGTAQSALELFRDFSVEFRADTVTALIAASGRGKTTLLDCIAGILKPDSGRIFLRDADTPYAEYMATHVSYLFQEPELLPWRTILRNASLPLEGSLSAHDAKAVAAGFLAKTGLGARLNAYPGELSGGERRRAALARAFAFRAPVLLMDEAFQSQDLPLKLALMRLTQTLLQDNPRTVILVTHDVREALCLADRILVLTGRPLTIARDISIAAQDADITGRYIHLPPALVAIEEDIFAALSSDALTPAP
jgi:ABC-type nitrate/sulfonate/bicarbonate transport system ATPase subunit